MTVADKTFTQPFDIIPEAVAGQALGDAGHVWDFYAGDIYMPDDGWIGIAANDLRIEFDSTDGDIMLGLGDAAGADQVQVLDSGNGVVAYIDSNGNADFEGHIAAGAGATVQAQTIADFSETYSGALAGNYYGLEFRVALEPNANFGSTHIGMIGVSRLLTAWVQTGGITEGVRGSVTIANAIAGTLRNARGANFFVDIEDGACATAVGVRVSVPYVDGGSITTSYGIYVNESAIGGGAITTQYGLYIEDMTNAGTNWAIYSDGGDSYHAGNFGIGTAAPAYQLDVIDLAAYTTGAIRTYSTTNVHSPNLFLMKSAQNTEGLTATGNTDILGLVRFYGVNTTVPDWALGAQIQAIQISNAGAFCETDVRFSTYSATAHNFYQLVLDGGTGCVGIGTITAPTANATDVLFFADNAVDPTMGINTAGFYAKDVGGTVEAFCVDEAGNVTQLSPHDPKTGEWIFFTRNVHTGREIRVDMERMVHALELCTGEQFLFERVPEEIQ